MSIPVTNITDSWVNQEKPTKNYSDVSRLKMATGTGVNKIAYIMFGKVWNEDTTPLAVPLRLYSANAWNGTITLTVKRLTERKGMSRVHYNNRPVSGGAGVSIQKANAPAGTLWELDIAPIMQEVINGAPWYGLELRVNGTATKSLHSAQSPNEDFRPTVEFIVSEAPEQPDDLNPRNNRAVSVSHPVLSMNFVDNFGDTTLAAVQVQISSTTDFSSPSFDSGWRDSTLPQVNLAETSYVGLSNGLSRWWRGRVRSGDGLESPWSEPVQFQRQNLITPVITNPASSPNNYVEEPTPPLAYTFAGVQKSHQLILRNPLKPSEVYWDTGRITTDETTVTPSEGVITDPTKNYELVVRVWDDKERQAEGGRPVYSEATRVFGLKQVTGVSPVSSVWIENDYPYPWVDVMWTRGTAADYFVVVRDGVVISPDLLPEDVLVSGTTYRWRDVTAAARVPHTWEVWSIQNGQTSANNPTYQATVKPNFTWLMKADSSDPIVLVKSGSEPGSVISSSNSAMQEVHQPVGGGPPVLVTQFLRKYEGHVEAVLSDGIVADLSGREMRDRYKRMRDALGERLVLYTVDETMNIIPYNMTYRSRAKSGGTIIYDVTFDFFEV